MAEKNYDIAIIGSGPGGYTAAIRAAQLNFSVVLIENHLIGGVCLNVGCIPTKTILSSADILDNVKKANTFGISLDKISFDLEKIIDRKDKIVQALRSSLKNLILSNKVDILEDEAKFFNSNTLLVKEDKIIAKNIIIATGSCPFEIENIKVDHIQIHDSTSLLNLKKLPKTLTIIGGGYIGCEFASFYARLGVKVIIIESLSSILYTHGEEISTLLTKSFKALGIEIKTLSKVIGIDKHNHLVKTKLEDGSFIESEMILVAVGRRPNTQHLGLEKIKDLKLGKKLEILVDEKMKTTASNIYAIGDVTGKWMLAHTASHEAIVAVDTIAKIENKMEYTAIPSIVFTKPEIAQVGLTLKEAKEKHLDIEIGKFPYTALGKAIALAEKDGFVQILVDKKTKIILGALAIGASSSIMIAEMALAITNKLTVDNVIKTIHAHPTLPEAWLEATLISQNKPINFPPNLKI